jgi:AcrR family transcriptional regulator
MRHELPSRRAPCWFYVLVAAVLAVALRELVPASPASGGAGITSHPPALAWWTIIVSIVEALWKGVEVAGRVALAVLQYSVHWAWRAIVLLGKGAAEIAGYAWTGLRKTWSVLKYAVLHPKAAWEKLWHWVDRAEQWLKDTVGPVLDWLQQLARKLRTFYRDYVQPWLDILDVTRRALRVLAALGVDWARTLDAKLGAIEDVIASRFLQIVGYLNDVINIVNRVVTADGLFQRLAFLRTLQRDYAHAWSIILNGFSKPLTAGDRDDITKRTAAKPLADVRRDVGAYVRDGTGSDAALLDEVAGQWRKYVRGAS